MNKKAYRTVTDRIAYGGMPLSELVALMKIDQEAAEWELIHRARMVGFTYGSSNQLPVYFFNGHECENALLLMHAARVHAFTLIGSPYESPLPSLYDTREKDPYIQAVVYDPTRKLIRSGLRFLQLYKGIPYESSSMSDIFIANDIFKESLGQTLEIGATFSVHDDEDRKSNVASAHYLLSALAYVIEDNDATYLIGRPTISGAFKPELKQLIASWFLQEFPVKNTLLNPTGEPFVGYHSKIPAIKLRAFAEFVKKYNIEYTADMPMRIKLAKVGRIAQNMEGRLPEMINFYSSIIPMPEDKNVSPAMMTLGFPVRNPAYRNGESFEMGIRVLKGAIASIYTNYQIHARNSLSSIKWD